MKECAFDNGATKCKALSEKNCEGCHFYKTIDQVYVGRQKAEKRIRSLPPTAQAYIKRKYYS